MGEKSPFQEFLDAASSAEQEPLAAVFDAVLGDTISSTTYEYDTQGRLATRKRRIDRLGGDSTLYRYKDNKDPIEETTTYENREGSFDESGELHCSPPQVRVQHARFEYIYDAYDKWMERFVSSRLEAEPSFRYASMERRTLIYHSAEENTRMA